MNPALQRAHAHLSTLWARATSDEVRARYRIGALLLSVARDEATYGDGAVAKLATAIGRDMATLYRYATVASRWSEAEITALVRRKNRYGQPLSWSHLVALAQVEDLAARDALYERALTEALSVRELTKQVAMSAAAAGTGWTRGVREGLARLFATAERVSGEADDDDALFALLDGALAEEDVPALLERAICAHEQLCETAQARLRRLREARARAAKLAAGDTAPMTLPPPQPASSRSVQREMPRLLCGLVDSGSRPLRKLA